MSASVSKGKTTRPVIFAGAFVSEQEKWCDIHIKFGRYRRNYIRDHFRDDPDYFLE